MDREDGGAMEADGVGPVRGSGGEDTLGSILFVSARVDLTSRSVCLVKPGQDPNFLSDLKTVEGVEVIGMEFERRVGSALRSLAGSSGAVRQRGANESDRGDFKGVSLHDFLSNSLGQLTTTVIGTSNCSPEGGMGMRCGSAGPERVHSIGRPVSLPSARHMG